MIVVGQVMSVGKRQGAVHLYIAGANFPPRVNIARVAGYMMPPVPVRDPQTAPVTSARVRHAKIRLKQARYMNV